MSGITMLSDDEYEFIVYLRKLTPDGRQRIHRMIEAVAAGDTGASELIARISRENISVVEATALMDEYLDIARSTC